MNACETCLSQSFSRASKLQTLEAEGASAEQVRRALDDDRAATGADPASDAKLWTLCRHESGYPARLTHFERVADQPLVIYGVGSQSVLEATELKPTVAIVGARRATAYGREVAYTLARDCAEAGIVVVSGMALGIDGAAHRGALQGRGPTIAVLAGDPQTPYPRSHRLLHEQIIANGCVISEMPPGTVAKRWGFVSRNRIIAGLAALTIVVEGSEDSGARHTVAFAEDLGLEVGVVPGPVTSPMSAGPNAALAEGRAAAIRGIEDVQALLGLQPGVAPELFDLQAPSAEAEQVLQAIACGQRDPRAIALQLPNLSPREISRLLGELELLGRIRRGAGGEYELTGR
jgi:DNA processing protein